LLDVTLSDGNKACGVDSHQLMRCSNDITQGPPRWQIQFGIRHSATLTEQGTLCGLDQTYNVVCALQGQVIPKYWMPLTLVRATEQGICGISRNKKIVCYFLHQPEWRILDGPSAISSLSWHGLDLCALTQENKLYCTSTAKNASSPWKKLSSPPKQLKNMTVQGNHICGTSTKDVLLCLIHWPTSTTWITLPGRLNQLSFNSQGVLCGAAQDQSLWCASTKDSKLFPRDWIPPKKSPVDWDYMNPDWDPKLEA
jgi:hypothetical protein